MCKKIIILTIAFFWVGLSIGISQNSVEEIKSNRFNVLVGVSLYEKGLYTQDTGDVKVMSINPKSLNLGFEYAIFQKNSFRINSGFFVSFEPEDNFKFNYRDLNGEKELAHRLFPMYSLSIPIIFEYVKPVNKAISLSALLGVRGVFISEGIQSKYLLNSASNSKVFELENFDDGNKVLGSIIVGVGMKRFFRMTEVGLRLSYVNNLKNIYNGGYRINEPIDNSLTKGKYSISGNYFGILFTVSIPKFKITKR